MRKYHYEYEVVNISLAYGGVKLGRYRTYSAAQWARVMEQTWGHRGTLWDVRKFRVYD